MTLSLICAALWLVVANILGLLPSNDNHWRRAYGLIAVGLPLLVWVYIENGFWVAFIVLAGAMSVLRWPVVYLWRWIKAKTGFGQ